MNKNLLLIVDDNELNRDILQDILEDDYDLILAADGVEALKAYEEHKSEIKAMLLDLVMPVMDGFQVLEELNRRGWNEIPVLVISAEIAVETERRCFALGVNDFVGKPFDPILVVQRINNAVRLYINTLHLEEVVAEQTRELAEQNELLKVQNEKLSQFNSHMIESVGNMIEARDPESGAHVFRVKRYTGILARKIMELYPEYELTEEIIRIIQDVSPLHDVGKIFVGDEVLLKPGRLTAEEFEIMKTHTVKGAEILETFIGTWDEEHAKYGMQIARWHHERVDGRGYPDKLMGDEIPISAQIAGIADVYDALVSDRVYKKAFAPDVAFEMIIAGQCGTFSDKIYAAFGDCKEEFEKVRNAVADV